MKLFAFSLVCCVFLTACASDSQMAMQTKKDSPAQGPQIQTTPEKIPGK
jgi:hypothetical protein